MKKFLCDYVFLLSEGSQLQSCTSEGIFPWDVLPRKIPRYSMTPNTVSKKKALTSEGDK